MTSSIEFTPQAAVYTRPDFSPELAWTAVHMFAGGFNGWEQAAQWVNKSDIPALFSQRIEIDADEQVMHLWEVKYQQKVRKTPISAFGQWDHRGHVGVLGAVHDKSILNLLQSQVSVCISMSPPCQSWSRAGKQKGLSSDNGIAFADGLFLSFCMQALTIVAECSDEITAHAHFQILKQLAGQFGYRLIWSQTVFLHRISPHYRSRWLGVWVRADLSALPFDTTVHPSVPSRPTWTHDDYDFALPRSWLNQMLLSDSEKAIYGDASLLPATRKPAGGSTALTQTQVRVFCSYLASCQRCVPAIRINTTWIFSMSLRGVFSPCCRCCQKGSLSLTLLDSWFCWEPRVIRCCPPSCLKHFG